MSIGTVIDIGANIGQFAIKARRMFPDSQIYSFEPLSGCFAKLVNVLGNDPKFHPVRCAIGAREAMLVIHESSFDQASSFLAVSDLQVRAFPHTRPKTDETVPVRRLDDVLNQVLAPDVLLKLDVQGFEAQVLDGAPRVLSEARVVISEVAFAPMYEGQPLFGEIYDRLIEAGLRLHGVLDQLPDPRDGRILQADAIFVRG